MRFVWTQLQKIFKYLRRKRPNKFGDELKGEIFIIKQVIVIRKDLNMRKGKMIAQGAHASLKVFLDQAVRENKEIKITLSDEAMEWMDGLYIKICLGVDSENQLLEIHQRALINNLPVALTY